MPIYLYRCPACSAAKEVFKPLRDLDTAEGCPSCGAVMQRALTAARVVADYQGYECPVTGTWVEGRAAHRENLARHGCRVLEAGEKAEMTRRKAAEESALDASIERTVDRLISELPSHKRDRLAAEMEAGVSATVIREGV